MKDSFQKHLDRVSRSFALCIAQLSDPLRQWISLSYLLCRVLDTIEDATWHSADAQNAHYQAFESFFDSPPEPDVLSKWIATFPKALPEGEQRLVEDTANLLSALAAMPTAVQRAIRQTVLRMSHGMRHYTQLKHAQHVLRLQNLQDVNRYCFFVAGIVGALLTQLFDQTVSIPRHTRDDKRNALHFGLFLQKINLLKDQQEDELEGRFLVPDRDAVIQSLRPHAQAAFAYILSLPDTAGEYRAFCAFSLFLGAQSLPYLDKPNSTTTPPKISRSHTLALMQELQRIAHDNEALSDLFNRALDFFPTSSAPEKAMNTSNSNDWFVALTQNILSSEDRQAIGVG